MRMQGGIADWIVRRAARSPSAIALVDGGTEQPISYSELERSVAALAEGLFGQGVRRGDRVALLMENSIEFVQVLLATASLGAVAVPINR